MKYLLIDPSEKDATTLLLFGDTASEAQTFLGSDKDILFLIDAFLKQREVDKQDLDGIAVVVGAGSFTGTRLAVTIANTFGYALELPLCAVSKDDIQHLQRIIERFSVEKKGTYISATYSGEPNIGGKK